MILKGSQRAGGGQLAAHLLRADENEHVDIHELRGFMADDLRTAFQEAYAVSKGTRAKQYLFSLSLNPPADERVPIEVFETAIEQIEQKLGLDNQPRAIVFHEKNGRRHAHAVWSRIDTSEMKAINLPHYKRKLNDVARELYLEHGWTMPKGFVDSKNRDPLNFSREEWQQARRAGHDPKALKRMFQDCWAISDSKKAFAQALRSRGFALARGDRRGFVAVDFQGEVYAIARYTGVRTRQVRERLGDPKELPSVAQAKAQMAAEMSGALKRHLESAEKDQQRRSARFEFKRKQLVERQREERQKLERAHKERWEAETRQRSRRLAKGLRGIWHRLSGKYARVRRQNERDTLLALQRDRREKDTMIFRHIEERQNLQTRQRAEKQRHEPEIEQLREDIARFREMKSDKPINLRKEFRRAAGKPRETRERDPGPGFEPEM